MRRKELVAACSGMGIAAARCTVVDSQTLRDGMGEVWGEEEVQLGLGLG